MAPARRSGSPLVRLILLASLALADAGWSQEASAQSAGADASPVAARGGDGLVVRVDELDRVLLERYGGSQEGRELLDLLLKARLLDRLAQERRIQITPAEVSRRFQELDEKARAAGESRGLLASLEEQGLTADEFRDFLRLSMIQERLTREALGLGGDVVVTGDQQEVWLQQEMGERGVERPAPPWTEGFVARCGDVQVSPDELADFLRRRLPPADVEETCWHILLVQGMRKRMPDLAPEALERGIEAEIERRRAQHAAEYPQISFEQRLGATGRTVEQLHRDPAVLIATLSRLWVDRTYGEDGLRRVYESERDLFEGRFGKAVRANMLFLVAGRFENDLNPRTFEAADEELAHILERVGNLDDFAALASQLSEEPGTREKGGELGWVTRADPRYPAPLRDALFELVDLGVKIPTEGRAVGPVRLPTGCAMLWASAVRESPSWEVMSEHVHEELRRRFIEDVLPRKDVEVEL